MRKILARLSDKDLRHARWLQARALIAQSGHPEMPIGQAMQAIIDDIEFMGEIRLSYDIPEEENFEVNLADGVISEGEDA